MRLIFDFDNGKMQWTDIYDVDRWGNVKSVTSPLKVRSEARWNITTVNTMLDNYFANIAEPSEAVKPRIEWPDPVDPVEVAVFMSAQLRAELLYPEYKPVPAHQPRRQ